MLARLTVAVVPWSAAAMARKGGASCPIYIRLEKDAAIFDLWLTLELAEAIASYAQKRHAFSINEPKALPKLHVNQSVV